MIILGLTGSIGMGKTVTANMLEILGVSVHDSDEEVHNLLAEGEKGNIALRAAFPYFSYPKIYGKKINSGIRPINKQELGKIIFEDDIEREKLEAILHPLVYEAQIKFIKKHKIQNTKIIALDIPLFFETGNKNCVDYIITVSAPDFVQTARVLDRAEMTYDKFTLILKQQMPNREKCARSDFIIHTGLGRAYTMKQLKEILNQIKIKKLKDVI